MTYPGPVPAHRPRSATATRAAILAAARRRFAEAGYDGTTMRGVAADVGVDAAMVNRYFGSKERLFAEAVEFALDMPDLTGVPVGEVVDTLLPRFFAVWEDEPYFLPLLRASATSDAAAAKMREVFTRQVAPTFAPVAVDHPAERAVLWGAQMLGVALSRYVLRNEPLVAMGPEELAAWLKPVLVYYLTAPYPVPPR